jgi:hypothetical protein
VECKKGPLTYLLAVTLSDASEVLGQRCVRTPYSVRLHMKMYRRLIGLGVPVLGLGVGAVLGTASAHADSTNSFPCGQVCKNSAVSVTVGDNARQVTKTSTSKDGTVTTKVTGKGPDLAFFNPDDPSSTYSLKGNGATSKTVTRSDGTSTLTVTGHNVLFYFPTIRRPAVSPGLRRNSSPAARWSTSTPPATGRRSVRRGR